MKRFDSAANFDPVDYFPRLDQKFQTQSSSMFEARLEESGVDETKNEAEYRKYKKGMAVHEREMGRLSSKKGLRVFFWVMFGICLTIGIGGVFFAAQEMQVLASALVASIGFLLAVLFLLLNLLWLNKAIAALQGECSKRAARLSAAAQALHRDILPLLSLFAYDDFAKLVAETTDMFALETRASEEKLDFLRKVYGYSDILGETQSVVAVMSGDISGNPFVRFLVKDESMVDKVYTGRLTISWSEPYTDGNGRVHYRTRTETLIANYSHPAPVYQGIPATVYGNMAAPKLSFLRKPTGVDVRDEKAVDHYVSKEEKRLRKLAEDAVKDGKSFQPLANSEFEALFHAYNRTNEVEYRLLFTPLAQQNMLELIKGKNGVGYGDDFLLKKEGTVNLVQSLHSQSEFGYDPNFVMPFLSVKELRDEFARKTRSLFKSLYFDLAPLFAIPLYQMTEAGAYDADKALRGDISDYEAMRAANGLPASSFRPEGATTDQILRSRFIKEEKNVDYFEITSLSYTGIPMTAYVPTMGGDGRMHQVPVPYVDYQRVSRTRPLAVASTKRKGTGLNEEKLGTFLRSHDGKQVDSFAAYFPSINDEGLLSDDLASEEKAFEDIFFPLENIEKKLEELDKKEK